MRYRVAVYADDLGQWVRVGPCFTYREDAVRYLATFASPFKRLVEENVDDEDMPNAPAAAFGLSMQRLEFAQFLIRTGRLSG